MQDNGVFVYSDSIHVAVVLYANRSATHQQIYKFATAIFLKINKTYNHYNNNDSLRKQVLFLPLGAQVPRRKQTSVCDLNQIFPSD